MKKYNYKKIRNKVANFVKQASYSPNNLYEGTVWQFHILPVVQHSLTLGKKLGADMEILELSALLHDIAAIADKKFIKKHHSHGAEIAERILSDSRLPKEKIIKIKNCILNHRGSLRNKRESPEEKILASADAMSHFSELADMMYLTYGVHGFKTVAGAVWLKNKLLRSWKKIIPAGRKIVLRDYRLAMTILNKAITRK